MNLVELAMKEFSGGTLSKLAGALGLPADKSEGAVGAAVPTMLAALAKLASTNEGAARLNASVSEHGPALSGGLGQMLAAPGGLDSLVEKGTKGLGGLLGEGSLGSLVQILSKFSGVAGPLLKSLLAVVGPALIRMLFQQKSSQNLDAGGLGRLLAGQKDHIAAAMPAGLGSLLSASNLVDAGLGAAKQAAHATGRAVASGAHAAGRTAQAAATEGRSLLQKIAPLLILLGLGLLAWQLFFNKGKEVATNAANVVATTIEGVDLPKEYGASLGGLSKVLAGITDVASAKAAVPALNDFNTSLTKFAGLWAKMPEAAKTEVVSRVKGLNLVPSLRAAIERILGLPGVADVVKPVFETILGTLKSFG